jgi:type IV pilus assembly protein PilM
MAKFAWGIDVSKSSAKAVRLERKGDDIVLTHFDIEVFPQGVDIDEEGMIKDAVEALKARNKIRGDAIAVSLPGHAAFNRQIQFFATDESQIGKMVAHEAASQIPFGIDEVLFDYHLVGEFNPGDETKAILFAIKRDIVESFLENLDSVGVTPSIVQFSPVAMYNFLTWDQNLGSGAVAIDFGADNTDLVVLDNPRFWIRNLAITGNDLTKAISTSYSIPFAEAEKIKKTVSKKDQAVKLWKVMEPTLKDLAGEIQRSMGFYKSISKTAKFDRLFLCGNASKTINMQKFMSTQLRMPAARLQNLNRIQVGGSVDEGDLGRNLPTLGAALGLALQALDEAPAPINLIPEAKKAEQEIQKMLPLIAGAVGVLLVAVLLMFFKANTDLDKLKKEAGVISQTLTNFQEALGEYNAITSEAPQRELWLRDVGSIARPRNLELEVLNALNSWVPDNSTVTDPIWVLNLALETRNIPREDWSREDLEFLANVLEVPLVKEGEEPEIGEDGNPVPPSKNVILDALKNFDQNRSSEKPPARYDHHVELYVKLVVAIGKKDRNAREMQAVIDNTFGVPLAKKFAANGEIDKNITPGKELSELVIPDRKAGDSGFGMGPDEDGDKPYRMFTIEWHIPYPKASGAQE